MACYKYGVVKFIQDFKDRIEAESDNYKIYSLGRLKCDVDNKF